MNRAIITEGENVLDIQSLARRAQDLGDKVDWWNNAIIWVLVFAAFVALGTVLATYMAFKRARQFADAQGELAAAKEKSLADDLSDKALKIEEAKRDAGIANQRAGEARLKSEQIARENIQLQAAVEEEKATRLELERSIAPRPLLQISGGGGKSNIDPLKEFTGINIILEYRPGEETEAGSLRGILQAVGWKLVGDGYNPNIFRTGVTIWRHLSPIPIAPNDADERYSEGAAVALSDFLESADWDTNIEMGARNANNPSHVPANTLRVQIGPKPQPYFEPGLLKELEKKAKAMREQYKEMIKKSNKE